MISYRLNELVQDQVSKLKYQVSDRAPGTYQELLSQSTASMVVWAGASDFTIFGDAAVNHAFRAWHDTLHISMGAKFTLEGERIVALEQARILSAYGDTYGDIVMIEVVNQAEYFQKTGNFPIDQKTFTLNQLKLLNK
jgi:hypothetical protein